MAILPIAARLGLAVVVQVASLANPVAALAHGLAHRGEALLHAHGHVADALDVDDHVPVVAAPDEDGDHLALHYSAPARKQTLLTCDVAAPAAAPQVPIALALGRVALATAAVDPPVPKGASLQQCPRAPPGA